VIPAAAGSTAPAGSTAITDTPGRPPPGGLIDLTLMGASGSPVPGEMSGAGDL
jgi:hypothetical protein